jgi:hypothetical protein
MRQWWTLYQHQEAGLPFEWFDPATGLLYNFTTGYTFTFSLVNDSKILFTGGTVVGAATSPNAVLGIGPAALAAVVPGIYKGLLTAHHTATNSDFIFEEDDPPIVEILKTPTV